MSIFGLHKPETYETIKLVCEGEAQMDAPQYPGEIYLKFTSKTFRFKNVSSVFYFDEVFSSKAAYPYMYDVEQDAGLFECSGSSYLDRLREDVEFSGGMFSNHKHFVYFDRHFFWHITAGFLEEMTDDVHQQNRH